jgi:hypothetical protein
MQIKEDEKGIFFSPLLLPILFICAEWKWKKAAKMYCFQKTTNDDILSFFYRFTFSAIFVSFINKEKLNFSLSLSLCSHSLLFSFIVGQLNSQKNKHLLMAIQSIYSLIWTRKLHILLLFPVIIEQITKMLFWMKSEIPFIIIIIMFFFSLSRSPALRNKILLRTKYLLFYQHRNI